MQQGSHRHSHPWLRCVCDLLASKLDIQTSQECSTCLTQNCFNPHMEASIVHEQGQEPNGFKNHNNRNS
jgi:hypothetical protein